MAERKSLSEFHLILCNTYLDDKEKISVLCMVSSMTLAYHGFLLEVFM